MRESIGKNGVFNMSAFDSRTLGETISPPFALSTAAKKRRKIAAVRLQESY
jgi:hypothetical protein